MYPYWDDTRVFFLNFPPPVDTLHVSLPTSHPRIGLRPVPDNVVCRFAPAKGHNSKLGHRQRTEHINEVARYMEGCPF